MNIEVRVIPGAKRREIKRDGGGLKVKLLARPLEGKANRELVQYLADTFSVRKSDVRILSGEKERRKLVSIPVDQDAYDEVFDTGERRLETSD
jgi:uncharacterized protein